MTNRFSESLIALGGVSGVLGGVNWAVSNGEPTIGGGLIVAGAGLLLARYELRPNGKLRSYT